MLWISFFLSSWRGFHAFMTCWSTLALPYLLSPFTDVFRCLMFLYLISGSCTHLIMTYLPVYLIILVVYIVSLCLFSVSSWRPIHLLHLMFVEHFHFLAALQWVCKHRDKWRSCAMLCFRLVNLSNRPHLPVPILARSWFTYAVYAIQKRLKVQIVQIMRRAKMLRSCLVVQRCKKSGLLIQNAIWAAR